MILPVPMRPFFASLLLFVVTFVTAGTARADYTATVNPEKSWSTWDGWGCSLAWWANQFGLRDDLADTIFTTRTVSLSTDASYVLPGLGMNIARYNIGGTSTVPAGGANADIPTNMLPFRQIMGFWLNWDSADPASASWDWTADANQRAMLRKAKARGANLFEAFSDAPMWWMCYNHSTAGSNGGGDNLQSWNYDQFARYLATVAKKAHDDWGIDFASVEPFNEPSAGWWTYPCRQEGCHFDIATQQTVLGYLRSELDAQGLQNVAVSASDENSVDAALSTWYALDAASKGVIGQVNTHGYSGLDAYRGPNRDPLYQAVTSAGKRLWDSEYGEGDASGLTMAQSIALDINQTHVSGWVYWQPFDSGGWGLVQANAPDNWIGGPNPKYYVLAQYSRHIRPGMAILDSGDPNTVAAYDRGAHKLALVTVNGGTGQWITYDLSRFRKLLGPVSRWSTATGAGDRYARYPDTAASGFTFRAWFAPNTVQTFEVQGVHAWYAPVQQLNAGGPAVGPYAADAGFTGGNAASWSGSTDASAANAGPPGMYSSERSGEFTYTLAGLQPNTPYEVRLHFAENTFTASGKRQFTVAMNGVPVLANFDVFAAAGAAHRAIVRAFSATSDGAGTISLTFSKGPAGDPQVNGIEVLASLWRPYTLPDVVRAVRFAGGLAAAGRADPARFSSADGKVGLADAAVIARKIAGLGTNP